MRYTFLTKQDILSAIKQDQLFQIVRDDDSLIREKESAAISWMKSYLSQRFDMDDTFPIIPDWSSSADFLQSVEQTVVLRDETVTYVPMYYRDEQGYIKNYCYHNGKFYVALQDSNDVEPDVALDSADFWAEADPRIDIIKEYCIDITIFYLHKRVTPRKIPDFRVDLFNMAKEWLQDVRSNRQHPQLPLPIFPDESTDELQWDSNPQNLHFW